MITVIVPVYKVEKYLCRCVESIINQSYKDLEIILVDDGSPDHCGQICDDFEKKDSRIKVIHKKNGGLSDARNRGIDVARGEYISFVDSDDYLHDCFFEELMNDIMEQNVKIAISGIIQTKEELETDAPINSFKTNTYTSLEILHRIYGEPEEFLMTAWGKIYSKELFKTIRYPYGKIHEDEFVTYKLYFHAGQISINSNQMYYYFQRTDSIMHKEFSVKRLDMYAAYAQQMEFYKSHTLIDLYKLAADSYFSKYLQHRKLEKCIQDKIIRIELKSLFRSFLRKIKTDEIIDNKKLDFYKAPWLHTQWLNLYWNYTVLKRKLCFWKRSKYE